MDRLPKTESKCGCEAIPVLPLLPPDEIVLSFLNGGPETTYAVIGNKWVPKEVKENGVVRKLLEEN